MIWQRSTPIHSFLFAVFPVLFLYSNNIHILSINEIIFPLSVVFAGTLLTWFILQLIIKNKLKSALLVSIFLILSFSYGHVFLLLEDYTIGDFDIGHHRFVLIPFFVLFSVGSIYLIRTKRKLNNVTTITNAIAITLVIITLVNIATYYSVNAYSVDFKQDLENEFPNSNNIKELPNIYFIILDGYAGTKSLKEVLNFDNQDFISFLSKRGFYIPTESYSNYAATFVSIPSLLNMEYVNYLSEEVGAESADRRTLYEMINHNKLMKILKSQGYTTVNFDSGWDATRIIDAADLNLCGDNEFLDSELLIMLVRTSILNPIYVKIFESDKIDGLLCIFNELPQVQYRTSQPVFVFAHIMLPHPPPVFGSNGEKRTLETLEPGLSSWEDKQGYLDQLKFTNKKISEVVDKLLNESEKPPIIIIQSDHGSAFLLSDKHWDNPTDQMIIERMNNINFYYLPYNGTKILYDNVTPVNSFRLIFNFYFNTDFQILEDKIYYQTYDKPYKFIDVTNIIKKN